MAAATTVAQVLPALLVIGLLGPLLASWKVEYPERLYFASQALIVIAVEGLLLYFIIRDEPLPTGGATFAEIGIGYSLIGIAVFVLNWAKKTPAERAVSGANDVDKHEAKHVDSN